MESVVHLRLTQVFSKRSVHRYHVRITTSFITNTTSVFLNVGIYLFLLLRSMDFSVLLVLSSPKAKAAPSRPLVQSIGQHYRLPGSICPYVPVQALDTTGSRPRCDASSPPTSSDQLSRGRLAANVDVGGGRQLSP